MNNAIIKTLCLTFVLFFSVFFIDINGVKADGDKCFYEGSTKNKTNGASYTTIYQLEFRADGTSTCGMNVKATVDSESSTSPRCTIADGYSSVVDVKKKKCPTYIYISCNEKEKANFLDVTGTYKCTISNSSGIKLQNKDAKSESYEEAEKSSVQTTEEDGKSTSDISGIKKWAEISKGEFGNIEYDKCGIIEGDVLKFLQNLLSIIQIIAILLLVIMTVLEFVKVITASEEDGLKGAFKNTIRRIVVTIVILLLPMLILWILGIVNEGGYMHDENGNIIIGEDGDPLCKVTQK